MLKKYSIIIFSCLSLLMITGCGKSTTNGISKNLQKCQSTCDQLATMYQGQETNYKTNCYSNCDEIEAGNQEKWGNTDWGNIDWENTDGGTIDNGWTTTTDGDTTTTNEEVMTNKDCNVFCGSYMRANATSEEREGCLVSCKAKVKVQSDDISDCDNIETSSDGLIDKDTCIATKAIDQKNLAYCEKIEDEMVVASCYIAIAQDSNDKSICNRIKNGENKAYCDMMFNQE